MCAPLASLAGLRAEHSAEVFAVPGDLGSRAGCEARRPLGVSRVSLFPGFFLRCRRVLSEIASLSNRTCPTRVEDPLCLKVQVTEVSLQSIPVTFGGRRGFGARFGEPLRGARRAGEQLGHLLGRAFRVSPAGIDFRNST